MHNKSRYFVLISCVLASNALMAEDIDVSKLKKVTPGNNPDCVEYFSYHDEMYCSTSPLSKEPVDPKIKDYETQKIVFDDRPWQAAWGKQSSDITTVEYITHGDNINSWHELVTSQYMPNIPESVSPKEYADIIIKNLKDSGFDPIVKFIEVTPKQVIYEFRITSPDNLKQDELQVVKRHNGALYALHYVIKKSDMGEENRNKWIKNLKDSSIK